VITLSSLGWLSLSFSASLGLLLASGVSVPTLDLFLVNSSDLHACMQMGMQETDHVYNCELMYKYEDCILKTLSVIS